MRREMSRPRPVPLPTSLVVKNGSKARACTSGVMPWPLSVISTTTWSPSRRVANRSVPVPVHRVDGVVDEVGPHLVQLRRVDLDRREVGVERAARRSMSCELRREHGERALDPLVEVDDLQRGAIHLRVRLHVLDEIRDPVRRVGELRRAGRRRRSCSTTQRTAGPSAALPTTDSSSSNHSRSTPAAPSTPAIGHACVDVACLQPGADRPPRGRPGRSRRRRSPAAPAARRRRRSRARNWSARIAVLGQADERRQHVVAGRPQRLDGAQRRGRRVVDLVGEPCGQRAERDQRLALAGRRVDAADRLVDADDHVLAEREPLADEPAEVVRRHDERAAVASRACPWPGSRRRRSASPHARQTAGPLTGRAHGRQHDRLVARCRRDSSMLALEQDPQVVGRLDLRGTARRRRANATLAGRRRSGRRAARRSSALVRNAAAQIVGERHTRLQVQVHDADRARSLADGRRDPLHRRQPHVAGGEHAGAARLEQERRPAQRPARPVAGERGDVGPGEDEARARRGRSSRRASRCGATRR